MLKFLSDEDAVRCWVMLAVSFVAYLWIFLPLLPADGAAMGFDHGHGFPTLLAGYYWFATNGPLAVPWFSPSQCGGVPFHADLIVAYFSVPQWLMFAFGPIAAMRATLALFAGLGAAGFYLLLRGRFEASAAAATVASVLFLFSGLVTYRMAIGHLGFHPFALAPWLAWSVLAPRPGNLPRLESACAAAWPPVAGGLILAYMFHANMVHAIPCAAIAVVVTVLVHGEMRGHRWRPWVLLMAAIAVSLALSASRLAAALALLGNLPRTYYPLPGFPSAWDLLVTVAGALFWRVSAVEVADRMTDVAFTLGQAEWEYGLGPAALVLLVAGAAVALARVRKRQQPATRIARSIATWSAIALALALPLILNWYEPRWNELLKSLPFVGTHSTLVRWFALYVPIVALLSGLALDRIAAGDGSRLAGAALVCALTIAWNAAADKTYYTKQSYDGRRMEKAWRDARYSGHVPPIAQVSVLRNAAGQVILGPGRNDALVFGISQRLCYWPTLGYNLEALPVGPLRLGPALAEPVPGVLNVKNPACYLFPRENGCAPGDHFGTDRRADAERFLRYEPFAFARPWRQSLADGVTIAALLAAAAVTFGGLFYAVRRALEARGRHRGGTHG